MRLESLKPGMTVYDVHRYKMGNTTLTTVGVWTVRVISVDVEKRCVTASWNTNPPKTFYERTVSKWRAQKPMLVRTTMGGMRLATREEKAAAKTADAGAF